MFDSAKLMYSSGPGPFYDYLIDGSLRFNDNDSAYLSRTPSSAGNRKTWTWSAWIKRGNLGSYQYFFHCGTTSATGNYGDFGFDSSDRLFLGVWAGPVLTTNRVFRDPSAWYHIVISVDTTQASASDRLKFYVNGEEETSFATDSRSSYYTLNYDTAINQALQHSLSSRHPYYADGYLDGYMAEVNFIDGTALDPTSFGEFKSGAWKPIEYTGSYGTNGFYLPLATDANDQSGQDNHWIANNLASTDYVLDSPTNNFATLNPIDASSSFTLSEGSLKTYQTAQGVVKSTFGMTSGKWYAEALYVGGSNHHCGLIVGGKTETAYLGGQAHGYSYYKSGLKYNSASGSSYGASYAIGDIIGIAFDADNGTLTYYKNGTSQGTAFTGLTGNTYHFATGMASAGDISLFNFGQDSSFAGNKTAQGNTDANGYGDFYYAPPTGYLALCTANIQNDMPESLDPAQDGSPQDHFNTVLYTGQTASSTFVNNGDGTWSKSGVGFKPDFTWFKARSVVTYHVLQDSVRGANAMLYSNVTNAENSNWTGHSFDTDGFTVSASYSTETNTSGGTHVAWCWKADNTSGSSNTDGSIPSTVSANTDAGFSIVSFDFQSTGNQTIGHGLSSAPDMIIMKSRDSSADAWWTYHTSIGASNYLRLNSTNASSANSGVYGTDPTSSVFTIGSLMTTSNYGTSQIAYCFHSVEGFSRCGSYTGNGSTDGPMIFCGFSPAFVIIKRTDASGSWYVFDNERNGYNETEPYVLTNASNTEATDLGWDLLSNGFKLRHSYADTNTSGGTYIYMAFASNPMKFSTAV